jgi:hypothetical protein
MAAIRWDNAATSVVIVPGVGESAPAFVASTHPNAAEGTRPSRSLIVAAAATSIAAMVIGLINIGRSFNYDEGVTYVMFVNGGSPWRALTTQFVFTNHQMFSVIQAVAWRIGLVGETSQRLLPVMCGASAVGLLTWWVGRRSDAFAGAFAGLVLLANPVFVDEFRALRGYSLATLAVLIAAIATERSWRDHRTRWLVVAAIAMVVAVTTHTYSALPIVTVAVVTAVVGQLRVAHVIAWLLAAISAFLVQLPILDDLRRNSAARGNRYFRGFGWRVVEAYLGEHRGVVVIMAVLSSVGLWTLARRSRRVAAALAASIGLVAAAVLLMWQVVQPYDLYVRFFVAMAPYVAALAAFGVHAIPARLGVVAGALAVVLLGPNARRVVDHEPTIRSAAAVVDAARADGRVVCGTNPLPLSVYTAPVTGIDRSSIDDPADFADCDVFVTVLSLPAKGRTAAAARFAHRTDLGDGIFVYSDTPVTALPRDAR